MDSLTRTRKSDPIDTTKDASLHGTDRAKVQEAKSDEELTSGKIQKENVRSQQDTEVEADEGKSTNTEWDQDSDLSFLTDTDEDVDTAEVEELESIEDIKRSTTDAEERMRAANIPCWIETQRKIKWRLAVRFASHPQSRWTKKQQNGTQDLASGQKQAEEWEDQKICEDDINHFLKPEETVETKGNDVKNNDTCIRMAKD